MEDPRAIAEAVDFNFRAIMKREAWKEHQGRLAGLREAAEIIETQMVGKFSKFYIAAIRSRITELEKGSE